MRIQSRKMGTENDPGPLQYSFTLIQFLNSHRRPKTWSEAPPLIVTVFSLRVASRAQVIGCDSKSSSEPKYPEVCVELVFAIDDSTPDPKAQTPVQLLQRMSIDTKPDRNIQTALRKNLKYKEVVKCITHRDFTQAKDHIFIITNINCSILGFA